MGGSRSVCAKSAGHLMPVIGYVPPGARTEELRVDVSVPKELQCEEVHLQSDKRVTLHGIHVKRPYSGSAQGPRPREVVILYLQGMSAIPTE